jgi:hypothetical protein
MLNRKLITYCLAFATATATHHARAAEQSQYKEYLHLYDTRTTNGLRMIHHSPIELKTTSGQLDDVMDVINKG